MRKPFATAATLGLVSCLLTPAPARASTFDHFGFNPRGMAMGGALTAAADDYTATFYNPAALGADKRVSFGFGLTLTMPDLFVDRGKADSNRPTALPSEHIGLTLGWLRPLGGVFDDRVAIGLAIYIPLSRVVAVQGLDPTVPQFYMFQNLQEKLQFLAGVSGDPVPWLSLGLGVSILANLTGSATMALDIANARFERREFGVDLKPAIAVLAGVHVRPAPGLALGLSWRGSNSISFGLPVDVREEEALTLLLDVAQTVLWAPHQLSAGISYTAPELGLTVAADLTIAMWSEAPDPSPRLSVDIGGDLLEAFGLDSALDLSTRTSAIDLGFTDTFTPRLGVEYQPLHWLKLRTGYFFRPTPAPRQAATTSYLDNDAHVFGFGAGFVFADPLEVHPTPVELDIAAQLTHLPRRTVLRDDPRDPVGDLSHGGNLWTFSASVSHRY